MTTRCKHGFVSCESCGINTYGAPMKDTRFIAQAILSAEELLSDGTHWDCSNSRRAVRWERDRDMTIILLRQALERLDGIEAKDPTTDN